MRRNDRASAPSEYDGRKAARHRKGSRFLRRRVSDIRPCENARHLPHRARKLHSARAIQLRQGEQLHRHSPDTVFHLDRADTRKDHNARQGRKAEGGRGLPRRDRPLRIQADARSEARHESEQLMAKLLQAHSASGRFLLQLQRADRLDTASDGCPRDTLRVDKVPHGLRKARAELRPQKEVRQASPSARSRKDTSRHRQSDKDSARDRKGIRRRPCASWRAFASIRFRQNTLRK